MMGMDCIADEPVPMTPTRFPEKSTFSCGQRPVCKTGPSKSSRPSKAGKFGEERHPVAITQKVAEIRSPLPVSTTQWLASSSKTAERIRVLKTTSLLKSKRSAAWLI